MNPLRTFSEKRRTLSIVKKLEHIACAILFCTLTNLTFAQGGQSSTSSPNLGFKLDSLQAVLTRERQEQNFKKDSILFLREQLETFKSDKASLERMIDNERKEKSEFITKFNNSQRDFEIAESKVKDLQAQNFLLDSSRAALNQQNVELELELFKYTEKIRTIEIDVAKCDSSLAVSINKITEEQIAKQQTLTKLNQAQKEAKKEADRANANRKQYRKALNTSKELSQQLDSVQRININKQEALDKAEAQSASQDKRLMEINEERLEAEKNLSEIRSFLIDLGISFGIVIVILFSLSIVYVFFFWKFKDSHGVEDVLGKNDPVIIKNQRHLKFYTKLIVVFRVMLFTLFGLVLILLSIVTIHTIQTPSMASKLVSSPDFWKVLITVASPIAFILSTFNILESKRIELLQVIFNYVEVRNTLMKNSSVSNSSESRKWFGSLSNLILHNLR